jgi:hypothetical protein
MKAEHFLSCLQMPDVDPYTEKDKIGQNYPCNRPLILIGLWDVDAPMFYTQSTRRWRIVVVFKLRMPARFKVREKEAN